MTTEPTPEGERQRPSAEQLARRYSEGVAVLLDQGQKCPQCDAHLRRPTEQEQADGAETPLEGHLRVRHGTYMHTDHADRPLRCHELKVWTDYYEDLLIGRRKSEIRMNDRGYERHDLVMLREWDPQMLVYTGRSTLRRVTSVTTLGDMPDPVSSLGSYVLLEYAGVTLTPAKP